MKEICNQCHPWMCKKPDCRAGEKIRQAPSDCNGTCVFNSSDIKNGKVCHAARCERSELIFRARNS